MKSAIIPVDMGDKKTAYTCIGPEGCGGSCTFTRRHSTNEYGTAEDVAMQHAAQKSATEMRVHVVESGRGRTFKVWRGANGYESREVL